jgi:hypothetical protein
MKYNLKGINITKNNDLVKYFFHWAKLEKGPEKGQSETHRILQQDFAK